MQPENPEDLPGNVIDERRVVELAQALIEIPSVNPFSPSKPGDTTAPASGMGESKVADRYGQMLADAGCQVRLDEVSPGRPNVVGSLRGNRPGPTLLLAGHLDTVGVNDYTDPFDARIEHGRLYGRGSCDMKAALASFVEVARILHASGSDFGGELLVAGIADEEDRMAGSQHWKQHWNERGPAPDFAIVGEPTSLTVCPAHKGQLGMFIRTFGKAVHSSLRAEGVNAIEKMADVIGAFADYNDELIARPHHGLAGHGTFSVGVISGGEIMSTVPDFCEVEVDRRLIPGESPEQVEAEYRRRLDSLAAADPDFRYEIEGPTMYAAVLDTPLDHPVVTAAAEAVEQVTGESAVVEAFTGSTDAPNFGCPAVILGPGSLAQAHSLDEYVAIDEVVAATHVYLRSALALLGASDPGE